MKNKTLKLLLLTFISLPLIGCGKNKKEPVVEKDSLSIVYTTDVHCGIDENLGYSAVYDYKEKLEKDRYVTLVDAGDYLQGDFVGAISSGEYPMEVMNACEYDIIAIGNHEFDYGIDTMNTRLKEFNGDVVACNISYTGHNENKIDYIKPYVIKDYGFTKVGYIGVTTPTTLTESDPLNFIEDGETVYDFGGTPEHFYSLVQANINKCKNEGANYIILLSHLGSLDNYKPYSSIDVIEHTSGVTAFLDGHCHADVPWTTVKNKDNVDTLLVDAGTKLKEFASLTINKNGNISYEFIDQYEGRSEKINKVVEEINQKADEQGNKVVANIDVDLKITDDDGIRMIRNREMPIGNLVADAYKDITGADIGVVNGGGIRDNLKKGDVTYKEIKNVHPFGNVLMKKKTTGRKILDLLEFSSMNTDIERVKDGKPYGENGTFSHVSGLKYTIDTSIPTSVVLDDAGNFIRVDGERRVKNVLVLEDDNYVPIKENKEYTIASHNFLLDSGGGGANMFIDDEIVPGPQMFDYEVLITYIVDRLEGKLKDRYSAPEGRIEVI